MVVIQEKQNLFCGL